MFKRRERDILLTCHSLALALALWHSSCTLTLSRSLSLSLVQSHEREKERKREGERKRGGDREREREREREKKSKEMLLLARSLSYPKSWRNEREREVGIDLEGRKVCIALYFLSLSPRPTNEPTKQHEGTNEGRGERREIQEFKAANNNTKNTMLIS
jgi:hypothetical protein